jgi:hypothetical protein
MSIGADPLRDIAPLHRLLTTTDLRRLPLWLLGSNDAVQRIAERAPKDDGGVVAYVSGLRALAIRNYPGAANSLAEAEKRGYRSPAARALRAYALCMAGDVEGARELAVDAHGQHHDQRSFWIWLAATCNIDTAPAGASSTERGAM